MTLERLSRLVADAMTELADVAVPEVRWRAGGPGAVLTTNVALTVDPAPGRTLAEAVAQRLRQAEGVADARVVDGLLQVALTPSALAALARAISAGQVPSAPPAELPAAVLPEDDTLHRVQYLASRAASALRNAADLEIDTLDPAELSDEAAEVFAGSEAGRLLCRLVELSDAQPTALPRVLGACATSFDELRRSTELLPRGDRPATDRHRAALLLAAATRVALARSLSRLGAAAPERM